MDIDAIPKTDILIAGFPCQAFSIAGKKGGFNDERGKLFFNLLDIIKLKKNDVLFLENAKNLENHENRKTLNTILNCLKDTEYFVKYKVLNTMDYANIPQNRERIYIVGFLKKKVMRNSLFQKRLNLQKK